MAMNPVPTTSDAPAQSAAAVTTHDTNALTNGVCRGVWVGGAGTLVVTMSDGAEVTFSGVPAGTLLPISVRRIKTASTATNIVALY